MPIFLPSYYTMPSFPKSSLSLRRQGLTWLQGEQEQRSCKGSIRTIFMTPQEHCTFLEDFMASLTNWFQHCIQVCWISWIIISITYLPLCARRSLTATHPNERQVPPIFLSLLPLCSSYYNGHSSALYKKANFQTSEVISPKEFSWLADFPFSPRASKRAALNLFWTFTPPICNGKIHCRYA